MEQNQITQIKGTAISVRGNDIDTDRIIPARFLKCVDFKNLGPHAFEDDRKQSQKNNTVHPFDNPKFSGSSILLVNQNFGCGSSREHAPQSLMRWGIKAIVGVSFAEIFYNNCVSLGIPCVTVSDDTIANLMQANGQKPTQEWVLDLPTETLKHSETVSININTNSKSQFLEGKWNPLKELLSNQDGIKRVAESLPYV